MQKFLYTIVAISLILAGLSASSSNVSISSLVQANSASSVNALLQGYNVSSGIIASLTYTGINYSSHTYLLAYSSGEPAFLINTTHGNYSIILNASSISAIIAPTLISSSLAKVNTTYLTVSMEQYNASSAGPMNRCLESTGLSTGATCTYANNCESCTQIPACGGVSRANFQSAYYATGGIYGPLAEGIMELEAQYANLTNDLSTYYSSVNSLSSGNTESSIATLDSSFNNISSLTSDIGENPLFPPPESADYSQCGYVGSGTSNVPSSTGPWYCSALGFCEFLTYNYTLLGNMQSYISGISSLSLSQQQVDQVGINVSDYEATYVGPLLDKQAHAKALAIADAVLPGYNSSIVRSNALLTHISNTLLQEDIARLQANYTSLTTNYANVNLQGLNRTLSDEYAALKSTYSELNSTYSSVLYLSQNNTLRLVELQSGNQNPSPQLTSLGFQEAGINDQLNGRISNISTLNAQLSSVSQQSESLSNNPSISDELARAFGAPVASIILSSSATPYSNAVSNAPLLSIIPAVIIGIIALALLLRFHHRLRKGNKVMVNKKTTRNWQLLFIAAIVLVLLFIGGAYAAASSANSQAPVSSFAAAVQGSSKVIIAINGTADNATNGCASTIAAALQSQHKQSQLITISGVSCNNGLPLETTDKCLSSYAASGNPVIILTSSPKDSISAYSYYGSLLRVSGDDQFMNYCLAASLVR